MQSHNGYDAKKLRASINYRNARNTDKAGNPRAKVTLGACALSDNIVEGDTAVGFKVAATR